MSTLVFEIIVVWLGFIGMLQVSHAPVWLAGGACGAVTLACVASCLGMRRGWGYQVGWLAQAMCLALGLLTPWMYVMGIVFASVWASCIVLGRRIEAHTDKEKP